MGTRCGDLDPGVLAFLERNGASPPPRARNWVNKKSAARLVRHLERHARVMKAADAGEHRALLALKAYCYAFANISAHTSLRWGDWTRDFQPAGIGQGQRGSAGRWACRVSIAWASGSDVQRNRARAGSTRFAASRRTIRPWRCWSCRHDEERMMAREALRR